MRYKLLLLAVAVLAACTVLSDLEVTWNIEGSVSKAVCSTYGIARWEVEARGPDWVTETRACGDSWRAGPWAVADGYYDITVRALTAGGQVIAERRVNNQPVFGLVTHELEFLHSDFGTTPGGAKINVYWNLNGTQDGTDTGTSWDGCSEVGASKVRVTVDGKAQTFDCYAKGNMSGSVAVSSGAHNVGVRLLDGSGADLTTEATGSVTATESKPGTFVADFYFNSFLGGLKTSMKGTYKFVTTWGSGKAACDGTSPEVDHTVVQLKEAGSGNAIVTPVTGPDGSTFNSDGTTTGKCYKPAAGPLQVKELTWGLYDMRLQGAVNATSGQFQVCWEEKSFSDYVDPGTGKYATEILVGAGTSNPTRELNSQRISQSGACAP